MHQNRIASLVRRSDAVATYGILTIGIIHTGLTPLFKPQGGEDAAWFAGSGLALCLLGVLNVLRRAPASSPLTRRVCAGANLVTSGYVLLVVRAVPEPQVYTVVLLVGAATVHSFWGPDASPSPVA